MGYHLIAYQGAPMTSRLSATILLAVTLGLTLVVTRAIVYAAQDFAHC